MSDGPIPRDMAGPLTNGQANGQATGLPAVEAAAGPATTNEETVASLREKEAHGARIHLFDPNASPEEKKAQALKGAADKLGPVSGRLRDSRHGGIELATDIGAKPVVPTISAADINKASQEEHGSKAPSNIEKAFPGGFPSELSAKFTDTSLYKIGWRGQHPIPDVVRDNPGLAQQYDIVREFIKEHYYGHAWNNAAIIFFAVFASYYTARFDMGWGWLFIILATCSTYYRTSIRRVRERVRDDLTRELAKQRLFTDHETVDWMNEFLKRFWLAYEPILSATIVATADQTLSASTPPGVDSLRMSTFTLGTKAPRIEFIRTHPGTDTDVIVMDWKISFLPNDVSDMTAREASDKVNPKIVLAIAFNLGKVLTKNIVVEDIAFAGTMRMRLKLMNNFPHVKSVDLSFLQPPKIDYAAKPIGFDLGIIPGLEGFINNQIHANLGPMMYDPNQFVIDLEQIMSSAPIDTAVGVLQVTVYNARDLKGAKFGGGLPDPYISFGIGAKHGLARSKIKHSTVNPHWNETKFLLVNSLKDLLTLDVYDFNDRRKDTDIGAATFDLSSLEQDAEQEDLSAVVMLAGRPRGTIRFDLRYFPVIVPKKLADGTNEPLPESKTGIVRVGLHQAKDLDSRRSGNECNSYAQLYMSGQPLLKTPTFKRNHNPMYESATEFLVTAKNETVIGVKISDNKGFSADPTLGFLNVKLKEVLESNEKGNDWFPLSGADSGKIRMSATFRPVAIPGSINSANDFRPPIGVVRLHMKKAIDLKNVEALTGGKSDPYVRVLRGGLVIARTLVHNNNLDPEFDEIVYAPVHHLGERLVLEIMDYQHNSKDRPLGQVSLDVKLLATEGTDKKEHPYLSTGPVERTDKLVSDGGRSAKGTLIYEARFYPCTALKGVAFEKTASPLEKVQPKGDVEDDGASIIELDDDAKTIDGEDELSKQMRTEARQAVRSPYAATPSAEGASMRPAHESTATFGTAQTNGTESNGHGVDMTREEVLQSQSGVLVFNIVSGNLAKKGARVEVAFDDAYWPAYTTEVARTTHQTWDEVGESFIREIAHSRIIIRLNEADKESREDIQADFRTDLLAFLEQCLDKPADFVLTNESGGNRSTVTISAKYVPVPIQLGMRETVNNCGLVRVDLVEGSGLKAADRNGKSDPYCHFSLNGERVYESGVQKKTLNPKWNEHFEMIVPSRIAAKFKLKVYDWDRVGAADKLGTAMIDLADIEPFESTTKVVPILDNGKESGTITIRLVFRPEFVARSRAATSTFVGTLAGGAAHGVGTVAGTGVHIVGKGGKLALGGAGLVAGGAGAVGKGVFSGVKHVLPGHHGRKDTMTSLATIDSSAEGYALANASMASLPQGAAPLQSSVGGVNGTVQLAAPVTGTPDFGILQVSFEEFSGYAEPEKLYCVVKHNGKTLDKAKGTSSNHAFSVNTTPEAMTLSITLLHKRFGKDKDIGSADLDVWSQIQPGARNIAGTVLSIADGTVLANLSWTPVANSPAAPRLVPTASQVAGPDSPASVKSKSRFSMHKMRNTSN